MSSNSNLNNTTQIYGHGIHDNGAKWGSYVKRNADGSFPYDERMKKERPIDWDNMILERVAPLSETASNPPYKTPKRWAQGRTKPLGF
jgi:hypothetical protein